MMIVYHDGKTIPTVSFKDPEDALSYGFTWNLPEGVTITSSAWLINDTSASDSDVVDGLRMDSSSYSDSVTAISLSLGTAGTKDDPTVYKVTNRRGTSNGGSLDRSFYLPVVDFL